MRAPTRFVILVTTCLLVTGATAGPAQEGRVAPEGQAKAERFVTSLTIFPVTLVNRPNEQVGEVVGLALEKGGFRKITMAETAFCPDAEGGFEGDLRAFSDYVVKHPIKTDFALYGAFLGSRKAGIQALRGMIVDRKGKVVWKEEHSAADPEFQRQKPDSPMACCVFLSERVLPMLVLAPADERKVDGPLTKLWARRSAVPPREEFDAMKRRVETLVQTKGQASVVVFPIRVQDKTMTEGAVHLVSLLDEAKLCRARVAEKPLWFEVKPNSNEQRVLWDMARAFQAHMKKHAPDADYALFGDYLMSLEKERVGAVHFVICDRKGDWVVVDFQNSHHADFKSVKPRTLEDCNRLVALRLAGYLKTADGR